MNEDPEMSELYRDAYQSIKNEKEFEYNESNRIHERFAYQMEGDQNYAGVKVDEKYIFKREDLEDEYYTTELTDQELDIVYKRYKALQNETIHEMEDLDNEADKLMHELN
jgi:hypothetical protein